MIDFDGNSNLQDVEQALYRRDSDVASNPPKKVAKQTKSFNKARGTIRLNPWSTAPVAKRIKSCSTEDQMDLDEVSTQQMSLELEDDSLAHGKIFFFSSFLIQMNSFIVIKFWSNCQSSNHSTRCRFVCLVCLFV